MMNSNNTPVASAGNSAQDQKLRRAKKASLAAFLGGALEYYDFFLYVAATALIFNKIFFPQGDAAVAQIASFATLAVGFIVRPLGAVIFGHLGDRIGRKNTLVLTLLLMGGSTFLIGTLPDFRSVGIWAPILLVCLRLMQGISAGGETAGASALNVEEAPEGRRGFFTSFTVSGISAGIALASIAFLPVAAMSEEDRLAWGWRIPFLASIIVLIVAFLVRRSLEEPEVFEEKRANKEAARLPIALMFQTHWRQFLQVALMSFCLVTPTFVQAFALAYSKGVGIKPDEMVMVSIVANLIGAATQPFIAYLSDRIGRRWIFIIGAAGTAALVGPFFSAIAAKNLPMIYLTNILIIGLTFAACNAIYPSWFAELFNVKVRYTGMAIGIQVGVVAAGFGPMIGSALTASNPQDWGPTWWIVPLSSVVAIIGALWAKETFKTPLKQLGNPIK